MTEADWAGVTAISTVALAALALFGDSIKRAIYSPKLELKLVSDAGELINVTRADTGDVLYQSRFFHAHVTNTARDFPFNFVSVSLLQVLVKRPGGQWRRTWQGRIPMQWQHETPVVVQPQQGVVVLRPYEEKTVGPTREIDLFNITEQGMFGINPVIRPNNLKLTYNKEEHGGPLEIALDIQARGDQGDSEIMRVEVTWDWTWREGAAEIREHIDVKLTKRPEETAAAATPAS